MVKVAACQIQPASTVDARKEQMHTWLSKAEAEGADFVCFPEGFLTGYYAEVALARKNSLAVKDAAFKEWLEITAEFSSTVIVGFNEQEGEHLFDSCAIFEQGKLLGVQRKHYLYHNYFTSGTSFSALQSKGITFGIVICLDTNYFEPARLLALQGATILFSPMCNRVALDHPYATRPNYYSHFVARSFENRCWLVTADWIWPNDGTSIAPGHSVIYNHDGQEVDRSKALEEQLLLHDIPTSQLLHEKGRRVHGSPLLAQELANCNKIIAKEVANVAAGK
jgi:predicted amidohydrolase